MLSLSGVRILIVEDEYLVAHDVARFFSSMGAKILGPVPSVEQARPYAENADAAVLDIDLDGSPVFPIADRLAERGVPFVFFTGSDRIAIPSRLRHASSLAKPAERKMIFERLFAQHVPAPKNQPEDISSLLPKLRLAARLLLSDERAADRLVELTLELAISGIDERQENQSIEDWLNALLQHLARDGARLLT